MPPISASHFWGTAGPSPNNNANHSSSGFTHLQGNSNTHGHGYNPDQTARIARYPRFPFWDSHSYLDGRVRANALRTRMLTARAEIQIILAATEDAIVRMGDLLATEPNLDSAMDLSDCHRELLGLDKDLIVWRRELVATEMFLEEQLQFLDLREVYMG